MLGVIGVATDITENRRAEASIKESEERYRELFENANDIIYTHDLQGNFTSLNRSGERITGYTREEAAKTERRRRNCSGISGSGARNDRAQGQ